MESEKEENNETEEASKRPRRSTRPSVLKMYGITELSEAFGIPLDSDSESDQEFAPPPKENQSDSSCGGLTSEEEDEEAEEESSAGRSSYSLMDTESMEITPLKRDRSVEEILTDRDAKQKKTICCVCLETSKEHDIVTCDQCGVSVHEGCYGVPEDDSFKDDHSDESSISTVPWFCDACKAGVENPLCELCPNEGGIFKQTINGCWVHMVCCLYISGVEYIEPDVLSGVTLDQLPPSRWGAKSCSLCDDEWSSLTGVCISCDAGLCRTFFHVTCAQKAGLLCEVEDEANSKENENEVLDAYFAHCSTHCDKHQARKKRKYYKELDFDCQRLKQPKMDTRLNQHLSTARDEYTRLFQKMRKWYKPEDIKRKKEPRWLHHSPAAYKLLSQKAKALGYSSKQAPQLHRNRSGIVSVGLNVEFVHFFNERGGLITQLENQIKTLRPTVEKLQLDLKAKERLKIKKEADLKCLKAKSVELLESTQSVVKKVNKIVGKDVLSVESFKSNSGPLNTSVSNEDEVVTVRCCVCNDSHDNHLIIKCDTCGNSFHIHCLDPPLSKVPKKTSKFGWQCEECCFDSEEDLKPVEIGDDEPQSKFGRRIKRRGNNWEQTTVFS